MPEDTVEHTIAKDEVYRRIGAALSVETDKPLRLSTFYSGDLPAHHRPWELHKRVFERGDLARPVEWLFRDGEQTWLPALVQQAEGNPKVSVWSLNGPMEPTLTIQVLDTVGLQYPLRPNDCGLVQDREVALLAWDQIRQGADQLLKAGERVARAESHAA